MGITPHSFDNWFDKNMDDPDPNDVLELYETIKEGVETGERFGIYWDGKMMFLTVEGDEDLPFFPGSSRDCFLDMMTQRWSEDRTEESLREWVEEQLSKG